MYPTSLGQFNSWVLKWQGKVTNHFGVFCNSISIHSILHWKLNRFRMVFHSPPRLVDLVVVLAQARTRYGGCWGTRGLIRQLSILWRSSVPLPPSFITAVGSAVKNTLARFPSLQDKISLKSRPSFLTPSYIWHKLLYYNPPSLYH